MKTIQFLFCLLLSLQLCAQELIPYRKNKLWGYADVNGKIVIEPVYEKTEKFGKNGLARVKKNGKIWLIDNTGNLKTSSGYGQIFDFSEGRAAVCRGGTYDYMQGEIVGGLWGYIDETTMEEIIPCAYSRAEDFQNGHAIVQTGGNWGSWGVIDRLGRVVLPFQYPSYSFDMRPFPGIRWHDVKGQLQADVSGNGEKWKIIDLNGKQMAPPKKGMHGLFKNIPDNGYLEYQRASDAKSKELQRNNNVISTPAGNITTTGQAWQAQKGFYLVQQNNADGTTTWGMINEKNEVVIPLVFEQIAPEPSEGYIRVKKNGLWGFYHLSGKQVVPCRYYDVDNFVNGLAWVNLSKTEKNNATIGLIDTSGTEFFEADKKMQVVEARKKTYLADEYKNEIALPYYNLPLKNLTMIGDNHVMADYGERFVVYNDRLQKVVETAEIVVLKNKRLLARDNYLARLIDLSSEKVLYDSLEFNSKVSDPLDSSPYGNLFKSKKTGRCGVISYAGNVVLPFNYACITYTGEYFIVCDEKDLMAIMDTMGNVIRPFSRDKISCISRHLFHIRNEKLSEIYDARTRSLSHYGISKKQDYVTASTFMTNGNKYGFIHATTEKIIEPVYPDFTVMHARNRHNHPCDLILFKRTDKKYDVLNRQTGQIILSGMDEINTDILSILAAKKDGRYCLYTTDGEPACDKTFDAVKFPGAQQLVAAKTGNQWGMVNTACEQVLDPIYENIIGIHDYYVIAVRNGKYGLVNTAKTTAIPFEYEHLALAGMYTKDSVSLEKSYAFLAMKNGSYALISNTNEQLTPFELSGEIGNYYTSTFDMIKNGKPALYSYNGHCILAGDIDRIEPFSIQDAEGRDLLLVTIAGKKGLYTENGKVLLPCEYDRIEDSDEYYHNDELYFTIVKNGKKGLMRSNGYISIEPVYDEIYSEYGDGCSYQVVKFGNRKGLYKNFSRKLADPIYDDIIMNEENIYALYMLVKLRGKYGVLDTSGRLVAPPQFSKIKMYEVSDGYVLVSEKNGKKGVMSTDGAVILDNEYDELALEYDFERTAYLVRKNKLLGLYDNEGKEILPCRFVKKEFSGYEGYYLVFTDKNGKKTGVDHDFKTGEITDME